MRRTPRARTLSSSSPPQRLARHLKAVRSPISHVRIMAVGGINEKNAAEFLKAGAVGLGVGGNLANRQWIADGAFEKITQTAQALIAAVRTAE